jgi:hypothetical protein
MQKQHALLSLLLTPAPNDPCTDSNNNNFQLHHCRRFPAFSPEQQAEQSQLAYEIEDMMSHIKGQYELAMGAVRGQAPGTPSGPYNAAAQGAPVAGGCAVGWHV